MILEIDNVELYFSKKRILGGIYLKAETGKVTGILGSNGSGKSCLLNIIFGTLQSKYKLIRLDNEPVLKPLYKTGKIGLLPQTNFTPERSKLKTVFNLMKVDWNLFAFNFPNFSKYYGMKFNQLSGGERRVVEIFLILKSDYKMVLLDEPFSHIAPLYIEIIKTIISEEKQNKIIIITDHLYDHILDTSDNLYFLKGGNSVQITDKSDLVTYKYLTEKSNI